MNTSPTEPRGHRLWFPISVVVLAGAGIGLLRLQPELEANLKAWVTSMIVMLGLVMGTIMVVVLVSRALVMPEDVLAGVPIEVGEPADLPLRVGEAAGRRTRAGHL